MCIRDSPIPVHDADFEARPLPAYVPPAAPAATRAAAPAVGNAALLASLKDELFAIESEKLSGTLSASEYAEVKAGLEALLKRALKSK